jgi:serine/threonine protein kinase
MKIRYGQVMFRLFFSPFQGVLSNGVHVAIKTRRGEDTSGVSDFQNELQIVRNLQHANIIKLVGCCIEGDNRIIVYENMTSGNLSHKIHGAFHLNIPFT